MADNRVGGNQPESGVAQQVAPFCHVIIRITCGPGPSKEIEVLEEVVMGLSRPWDRNDSAFACVVATCF